MNKISTYIQRIKNKELYEKITKPIEKGGLGLINIEERVQAIKVKELLQAGDNRPETDDLIYDIGLKQHLILDKGHTGPKSETLNKNIKNETKKLEENIVELKNYKKRKKKMKTKDIHEIIFTKQDQYNQTLFIPNEPKGISINFLIANNLLPTWSSMDCQFCGRHKESIDHIFLTCDNIKSTRNMINNMLKGLNSQFTKTRILKMENINNKAEAIIITKYKEIIWNIRHKLMGKEKKKFDEKKAKETMDDAIYKHLRLL